VAQHVDLAGWNDAVLDFLAKHCLEKPNQTKMTPISRPGVIEKS
jgi:hypothetical protein